MKRTVSIAIVLVLVGCTSLPPVPPECRVRRPFIGSGVPLSVHAEVERIATTAEEACIRKKQNEDDGRRTY